MSRGSTFSGQNEAGRDVNQIGSVGGNLNIIHNHKLPSDSRKQFFKWLPYIDFSTDYHIILEKRYRMTGEWIFHRNEFRQWFEDEKSTLLWCWGSPGVGKSVLSAIVIDYLQRESKSVKDVGIAYSYFKYDLREHQSVTAILASFIKQLCHELDEIPQHLMDLHHEFDRKEEQPPKQRYLAELKILSNRFQSVYIVMDALDECMRDQRDVTLNILLDLIRSLPRVKIFVTSRKESDIEARFNRERVPVIPIEAVDVGKDIESFVRGRCRELVLEGKLRVSPKLEGTIKNTLTSRAQGMFLWVNLQLERLCHERRETDIEAELTNLPRDLNKTYLRIVEQINEIQSHRLRNLAKESLLWVLYATRPLGIKELLDAVTIDKECLSYEDLERKRWRPEDILEACMNLLTIEDSIIRPIHYSVQEFFMKKHNSDSNTILDYTANRNLAYTHLANCCIRYLMLDSLADTPCSTDNDLFYRLEVNPLAAHSAYSFDHYFVQLDSVSPDLQRNLDQLLLGSKKSLASILQLRRLRDNRGDMLASFISFQDDIFPEDIIYATALYNSAQLLSINNRWKDIKAPQYALHRASGAGIVDAITPLVEAGQDVQGEDTDGITPLYYACEGGYVEACKLLIKFRANINAQGGYFGNSLQAASSEGHEGVVRLLVKEGADANTQGGYYGNALQAASSEGHEGVVRLLVKEGADVNAQGGEHNNALQAASLEGHEAVVRLLVKEGADVTAQGGYYGNALQAASSEGHEGVVRLLVEEGADVNAQGGYFGNALQAASSEGHEGVVRLLVEEGADVNAQGGHYGNALQAASSEGHEGVVRLLVKEGADINAQGGEYGNAIQAASYRGHKAVVELLVKEGVDVNAQGGFFGNALRAASSGGHEGVVELLVEKGANINAHSGSNALQDASLGGHEAVVRLLVEKGADVNAQGGFFGNALRAASSRDNEAVVRLLVEKGADVNAQGGEYGNAIQTASSRGHEAVVRLLVEKGADINAQDRFYGNALQAASLGGHEAVVRLLVKEGADVNAQGGYYGNALQAASSGGHELVVRQLVEDSTDINAQGGGYGNAFQGIASGDHEAVVRLLIEEGANINARGGFYGTALQAASSRGHEVVVRLLINMGAKAHNLGS